VQAPRLGGSCVVCAETLLSKELWQKGTPCKLCLSTLLPDFLCCPMCLQSGDGLPCESSFIYGVFGGNKAEKGWGGQQLLSAGHVG